MGQLQRGLVKWFNDAKGFGFIEHESGRDVFVHYSVIESEGFKTLKDGEEVDYELSDGDKGLHAAKVFRVNAPKRAKAPTAVTSSDGTSLDGKIEIENTAVESTTSEAISPASSGQESEILDTPTLTDSES